MLLEGLSLLKSLLELLGRRLWLVVRWWLFLLCLLLLGLQGRGLAHLSFKGAILDVFISSQIDRLDFIDLFEEIRNIGLIQLLLAARGRRLNLAA